MYNGRDVQCQSSHTNSGSVAESMGRIVGETPLPVEESESGTVPRGMPASGTPSPNPWDLSLSRQNVCSTLKELERRIGLRRDATRAPIQGPEWRGAGFHSRPQNSNPDRKSTRLNSSHANISYAVFCLKKK